MTFLPMATRIRLNLRPQRASIILPIVAATALLAALSMDSGQADAQESPSNPYDGLPPISMSVFLDVLERQGSLTKTTAAPSGECSLYLTLTHDSRGAATLPANTTTVPVTCTVSASPTPQEPRGTMVGVATTGNCEAVTIVFKVDISPRSSTDTSGANGAGGMNGEEYLQRRTIKAKFKAIDLISLNIIRDATTLSWSYSSSRVSEGHAAWERSHSRYWDEPTVTEQLITTSPVQYTAYSSAIWHSDGLFFDDSPDVDIVTRATAFGFADGRG